MSKLFVVSLLFASAVASAHSYQPLPEPGVLAEWIERQRLEAQIDCALRLAGPLQEVVMPTWPIELDEVAGIVVRPGETIPEWAVSEFFLWQTWKTGELALVPRYNLARYRVDLQGVNTHSAFDHLHYEIYGTSVADHATGSGEGRGTFGEIWYLNNKSGKMRGEEETLRYPEMMFLARGAHFSPDTIVHVMNRAFTKDIGHKYEDRLYDKWQIKLMDLVLGQPDGRDTVAAIERLGRALRPLAGSARAVPGYFIKSTRGTLFAAHRMQLVTGLSFASKVDGLYAAVQTYWISLAANPQNEEGNFAKVVPDFIDTLIANHGDALADHVRTELLAVRAAFAALPVRRADPGMLKWLSRVARPPELPPDTDTEIFP